MQVRPRSWVSVASVVLCAVAQQAYAGPVLLNGSFESGGFPGSGAAFAILGAGSGAITSWTVGGAGVDYFRDVLPVDDGHYYVDLCRGPGDSGFISQAVSGFSVGTSYTLTFDVKMGSIAPAAAVTALLGSSSGSFLSGAAHTWSTQTLTWLATTTTATVRFQDATSGAIDVGVWVDNVRLTETPTGVPLPTGAAQAGALGGLALVWTLARRKRATRA